MSANYFCQEPGCTYLGTRFKSNLRKHIKTQHGVTAEETEWFRLAYPDQRVKPDQQKILNKRKNQATKNFKARKVRAIEKLKKRFPLDEMVEVEETIEEGQDTVSDTESLLWPLNYRFFRQAFRILIGLGLYSRLELAEAAWSATGVKQWTLLFHPDKVGQKYIGLGLGDVNDFAYTSAMADFPPEVLKPSSAFLRRFQAWLKVHIELGDFSDRTITRTLTRIVEKPRWATESDWLAFLNVQVDANLADIDAMQASSSVNPPEQVSEEESDF